ncbi:hypothetical protein F4677DRAFT_443461 [Hypoxylon crocopeplum]|nr:hypothetical protein F4677DRAFT_443461 [Hypoxylon crocopeplum]
MATPVAHPYREEGKIPREGLGASVWNYFPAAYKRYHELCKNYGEGLLSLCRMIPPQPEDYDTGKVPPVSIACLFVGEYRYWWRLPFGRIAQSKTISYAMADTRNYLRGDWWLTATEPIEPDPAEPESTQKGKRKAKGKGKGKEKRKEKEPKLASRSAGHASQSTGQALSAPVVNWGDNGEGMVVFSARRNGEEFRMHWDVMKSVIRNYFSDWEGIWYILDE